MYIYRLLPVLLVCLLLLPAASRADDAPIDFVAISKSRQAAPASSAAVIHVAPSFRESVRGHLDGGAAEAWSRAAADGDIVIDDTPPAAPVAVKEKAAKDPAGKKNAAVPPVKVKVQLRTPPEKAEKNARLQEKNKSKSAVAARKAPVVNLPPAKPVKPVLTRRQILDKEIRRERAALHVAQTRLAAARKSGNAAQIAKFANMVRERELNIQSLHGETVK